ncbi:MAG: NAD(P)-binding protein [Lachnospiraceae bacterium]|nr:NAD(P)-binding protein [Cuneatibacter sp.]MDD6455528.1 NAD(P)-binding protein [Lachnospiraceae bacterium]
MIRISSISVPAVHTMEQVRKKVCKTLHIRPEQIKNIRIAKRSIDARKKPDVRYIYTVDVETDCEKLLLKQAEKLRIVKTPEVSYTFPELGNRPLQYRPVIVGSGPCGLFCAYLLAEHGYRPILIERGAPVEERAEDVENFWKTGILKPESNVQFGEGGAGTFSDGKLGTMVKDTNMRMRKMLEVFVECGAPEEILYVAKPHIGTDLLRIVIRNMRLKFQKMGGEIRFHTCMTDVILRDGRIAAIELNGQEMLTTELVVLALGHSARDTFEMLYERGLSMQAKPFAMGVRIEHPQAAINESQYGSAHPKGLSAADYKLTAQTSYGRGVYSFCMCPGGIVVNASSEPGRLAVNGMSNHARDSRNANSALIVTVSPEDYPQFSNVPKALSGMAYQRQLEKAAYEAAGGAIPMQLLQDFERNQKSQVLGEVAPCMAGASAFANLRQVLPENLSLPLIEAMDTFDRKIHGYHRPDAILSGIESRTSSPIRMERNEQLESNIAGIYPCGEGAGYAGGITSAAMDGMKVAEQIGSQFRPGKE